MQTKLHLVLKALISLAMLFSVFGMQTGAEAIVEGNKVLGYPEYLFTILSIAYVIGVLAIWQPMNTRLQEWGYAGLSIGLVSAFASHLLSESGVQNGVPAIVLLALLLSAYFTRAKT